MIKISIIDGHHGELGWYSERYYYGRSRYFVLRINLEKKVFCILLLCIAVLLLLP